MSKKNSHILLTKKDFDDCRGCRGGASKLQLGKTNIFKDFNKLGCSKCIDKVCRDCKLTDEVDFAYSYQQPVLQDYYDNFFQNKNIPWFGCGINDDVKRMTEGKHPNIIKTIVKGGKLLDVGAGCGWLVGFLREVGVKAFGCDYSEYAISNAHKKAKKYMKLCDSQELEFENSSFDMVVAREVLEHLTVEQVYNTIEEMVRVCKPNGLLYFTIWLNFKKEANSEVLCSDFRDPSHVTYMPRAFWLRFISDNFPTLTPIEDLRKKLDWLDKGRTFVYTKGNS